MLFLPLVLSIQQEKSRRWWRLNKKPQHKAPYAPQSNKHSTLHRSSCTQTDTTDTTLAHVISPAQESSCSPDKNTNFPSVKHHHWFSLMVQEVTMEVDKAELSVPFSTWYHIQDHEMKRLKFIPGRWHVSLMPSCVPATNLVVTDYPTTQTWLNSPCWKFLQLHSLCCKEAGVSHAPKTEGVLVHIKLSLLKNQTWLLEMGLFLAHTAICTLGLSQMKGTWRKPTLSLKMQSSTSGCEHIYNTSLLFVSFFIILPGVNKACKITII